MSAQNFRKASTQRSEWQEFKEEHTCNEGVSYIKRLQIKKQGTDAKMRQCLEAGLLVSFHIKKTKKVHPDDAFALREENEYGKIKKEYIFLPKLWARRK